MVLSELLVFIIVLIGIMLFPVGYQMYTTTRLIWGGILTMIYGILCFVAALSGIISLI